MKIGTGHLHYFTKADLPNPCSIKVSPHIGRVVILAFESEDLAKQNHSHIEQQYDDSQPYERREIIGIVQEIPTQDDKLSLLSLASKPSKLLLIYLSPHRVPPAITRREDCRPQHGP